MIKLFKTLGAAFFFAGIVSGWAQAAFTAAQLLSIHQGYVNAAASSMNSATSSGNSQDQYFTSIDIMGMLDAVEATNTFNGTSADQELQQAMHYIDNMIASAGTANGHHVWYPLDDVYNFQGAQCIARAAAVIYKYGSFKSKYATKATAYASFVDDMVIQYWFNSQNGGNPAWLIGDPPSWGDGQAWNDKSWMLGDICNSLYRVTGNPFYLNLLNRISNGFKSQFLQPMGAGWVWNYHTFPIGSDTDGEAGSVGNQDGSPDTDHANRVPLMMVYQYEEGVGGWSLSDIQRLANTLGTTMWNQSTSDPLISNYVDGSNKPYRTHLQAGENGFIFGGWAILGQYGDSAEQAAEAVLAAMQANRSNPTLSENLYGYYKPVGLTGHLMRAFVNRGLATNPPPAPTPPPVPQAPPAPVGVKAAPGNGQATISWSPVSTATSYNLYRSRYSNVSKANGFQIKNVSTPYLNTGWVNGTTYYMVVTAVNAVGESPESAMVSIVPQAPIQPPTAPTGVIAVPGNTQATLSWNPVAAATTYNLYRSRWPGVTKSNGYQIKNVTSPHLNTGWVNGTAYYMVVTAVNAAGESPESAEISAVPESGTTSVATQTGVQPIQATQNDLRGGRVYPNPWRANIHSAVQITFDQLTDNSTIRIFTLTGHLLRTLSAATGSTTWDLKNDSGDHIASGLYLYLITNPQGQQLRGKMAIIR